MTLFLKQSNDKQRDCGKTEDIRHRAGGNAAHEGLTSSVVQNQDCCAQTNGATFQLPTAPVRVTEAVVGRSGLEPPASAVIRPERCSSNGRRASPRPGVMWFDFGGRKGC